MEVFLLRFFKLSQFKRSCLPNGPKVGSGGSLSPRGDWRAPSDSEADAWLEELRSGVPDS
jgi:NAD+ synthase (glutamine-hydrolysing)